MRVDHLEYIKILFASIQNMRRESVLFIFIFNFFHLQIFLHI